MAGARALAPNLGERMLAARLNDRSVVVRELLPQDLKLEIEQLTHAEAVHAARFLATVVGEAHARQMDRARAGLAQRHAAEAQQDPGCAVLVLVQRGGAGGGA